MVHQLLYTSIRRTCSAMGIAAPRRSGDVQPRQDLDEPLVRKGPWLVGARVRSPQQEGDSTFFNATVHSLVDPVS